MWYDIIGFPLENKQLHFKFKAVMTGCYFWDLFEMSGSQNAKKHNIL